ncbi:hypothetical protein [Moritella yayanosii]|uniref:Uncharacterized protein n=1 Tax=Moritella yayanosii TaxID=69539 RepID=A0A330LW30_9GAMM|nr:hypothetical protein [Moritella yayanosii]SQD80516.1 conserved protein of unknown function [Moritella yayanosii]
MKYTATTEYLMVSENMMKQRVPRQKWRFFLRVDAFEHIKTALNKSEVRRYK